MVPKNNQIVILQFFHENNLVFHDSKLIKIIYSNKINFGFLFKAFFLAMLNSFVHVIMYSYYGFSAMGPAVQKYLWWKKYLTQLQLVRLNVFLFYNFFFIEFKNEISLNQFQFLVIMIHSIVNLSSDCTYSRGFSRAFVIYGIFITALFMNFYIQSYNKPKKANATKKD